MKNTLSILVLFALLISACSNSSSDSTNEKEEVEEIAEEQEMEMTDEEELDESISDIGILKSIDDSGYPFFYLTIEFPKIDYTTTFDFNAEEGIMDLETLHGQIEKYISFSYTTEDETRVIDIRVDGKTLYGEYAPESIEGLESFTGVLSGADEPTPGDLPSKISVTSSNGASMNFEEFIEEGVVAANGKEVTAYYYIMSKNKIVSISPPEEEN